MKITRFCVRTPLCSVIFLVVFLTLLPGGRARIFSDDASNLQQHSSGQPFVSNLKWEKYILEEVNRLREAKGLVPLRLNPKAQAAARNHSLDMARLGYFSH